MKRKRSEETAAQRDGPEDITAGRMRDALRKAGLEGLRKPPEPPRPQPAAPPLAPDPLRQPASEEDAFSLAMTGVKRSRWSPPPAATAIPEATVPPDDGSEDRRLMEEAMRDDVPGDVTIHPEYIEGWVDLRGRRYLPELQARHYSIQDSLDLHGLTRVEARIAVEEFIVRVSRLRSCCVKLIHGRGINSLTDRAILKESLQSWLSSRRMSRHVVAYASAPFSDGGVGAVYVLLRRS